MFGFALIELDVILFSFFAKVFVWHCLCRRSHGQHSRHLRRPPLHQNADSHQLVHFEFGGGRRMFSHRHSIYYDDNGPGILAIWQRHVQGEITSTPTTIL